MIRSKRRRWRCYLARPAATTLDEFVRQAASDARRRGAATLEIGPDPPERHRPLFRGIDYRCLRVTPPDSSPLLGLDALPVSSGGYGLVLCTGMTGRWLEPRGMLAELHRALELHGRMFATAPLVVPAAGPVSALSAGRRRYGLNYAMEAAGFRIEAVTALDGTSAYAVVVEKRRSADVDTATWGDLR